MSLEKTIKTLLEGRENIQTVPRPNNERKKLENVGRPNSAEPTSDKTTHTRQAEIQRKIIDEKETIMNRLNTSSTKDLYEKVLSILENKKEKKDDDKDEKKSKKNDDKELDDEPTEVDVEPETKPPVVDGEDDDEDDSDKEDKKKKKMKKEDLDEKVNAYAVGMSQAKKIANDEPPLKKSTIMKGHEIAKKILKKEDVEVIDETSTKKLMNYHDSSISSVSNLSKKAATQSGPEYTASVKKIKNREAGQQLAASKIGGFAKVPSTRNEDVEIEESSYSAKAAHAGKDIGKPGKNFEKIEKSAAKKYGSEEAGKRVAGAVLAKLRKEDFSEEELAFFETIEMHEGFGEYAQKNQNRKDEIKHLKDQMKDRAKMIKVKQQDLETQQKKKELLSIRQQLSALNQDYEHDDVSIIEAVKKSIEIIVKNPAAPFNDAVKGVKSSDAGQTHLTDSKKIK